MLPASLLTPSRRRILVFVAVGCAAALVHWLTVVALVSGAHAPPLAANVGGWAVAFCVSFAGQAGLTFRDQGAPLARSARRFLLVSLGGFALNEASYALLLRWSPWRYDLLLALVLLGVAALTYLLSRHWAFRRS
jgi:putative flippase GtrA